MHVGRVRKATTVTNSDGSVAFTTRGSLSLHNKEVVMDKQMQVSPQNPTSIRPAELWETGVHCIGTRHDNSSNTLFAKSQCHCRIHQSDP